MWALAVSPAMMMTGGFVLMTTSLPHLFTTLGYVGLIRVIGAGNMLLGALMPLILTTRWLRPLVRGGYGVVGHVRGPGAGLREGRRAGGFSVRGQTSPPVE